MRQFWRRRKGRGRAEVPRTDGPEVPVLKKKDEEERRGGGVPLPGSQAGGLVSTAPRGPWRWLAQSLRRYAWLQRTLAYRILLGNPVGRGLTLGAVLAGATFLLVKMSELKPIRPDVQAPQDFAFQGRYAKSSEDLAQWGLLNEGLAPAAKSSMFVVREPGAQPAKKGDGPEEYRTDVDGPGPGGAAGVKKESKGLMDELTRKLSEKFGGGKGGRKGLGSLDGAFDGSGSGAMALGGSGRIAASQGFVKPFARPAMGSGGRKTASAARKKQYVRRGERFMRRPVQSKNAMGQLKIAKGILDKGKMSTYNPAMHQAGVDAYNQQNSVVPAGVSQGEPDAPPGSGVGAGSGTGGGTANPPQMPNPGGEIMDPEAPELETPENETPYQEQLDMAKNLIDQGESLKQTGTMLIAIGVALMVIGYIVGWPWGAVIAAIGALLAFYGMNMVSQAQGMADQAHQIGQSIQDDYGQDDQGQIVKDEADKI